jgi:branched-chain amino acid transport system ATP-binding protein
VSVPEPLLALDAVEVRYGTVAAVRDLTLEVGRGEIVGLIGPNGAGKSTTLHAVMGVVPCAAGEIRLVGASLRGRRPEEVARLGVALVPEGRRIFPDFSVEENLRLGLAGRRANGAAEALESVYGQFPVLAERRRRPAGTLSGGQQQQLAIGRALVAEPDLLLLDEPSLGLAPKIVDLVFDVLAGIRERGVTILLVEQRAQRTVAFADRTYVLASGALRVTLGPADADATDRLVAAYFA